MPKNTPVEPSRISQQPRAADPVRIPHAERPSPRPRGVAWLGWTERRGLIDLALGLVLLAQWLLMPAPPGAAVRNPDLRDAPVWCIVLLPLLTWLLLAAGALAPLTRRRGANPWDFPPGAGLWLGAYVLMALSWFAILLNNYPENYWGFWHLARMDAFEAGLFALLVPVALAPGWRRLARRARLAWLRRRRRGARIPFASVLPLLLAALYAWLMTDHAVMSDGFGITFYARLGERMEPNMYREPGTMLLLQGVAQLLMPLGLNAAQAIRLASFCAALGTMALLARALRLWGLDRTQRAAGWWLILSSLGLTQMMLGHVELYPLVQLAIVATVVCAMAALAGRISPAWMAAVYALGLFGHLSLIFILPAVLLALWLWTRPRPGEAAAAPPRTLGRAAAHLFGWGALVHLPAWTVLMLLLPRPTPAALVAAVRGSLNTGAKGIVETRMGHYTLAGNLERLFSAENLFKPVQLLFYLAGGALLTVVLLALSRLRGATSKAPSPPDPDPTRRRQLAVIGAAFAGYFTYMFVWRNDWPWMEDWDLFSGLTPLAVLLAAGWLMPARGALRLPAAVVRRLCLFSLLLSITQHYYNHAYATFLNCVGKINQEKGNALLIQRYEVENGWRRGYNHQVVNGRIVEYKMDDH